jgi:hypothetical protein
VALENPEKDEEAEAILSSCLGLLLELEEEETGDDSGFQYASRISPGAKLYHLMNMCLHPETLLQRESLIAAAEKLFAMYAFCTDSPLGLEFTRACSHHSGLSKKASSSSSKHGDSTAEKLASRLLEGSSTDGFLGTLSKREMRALEEFAGDISEAYMDYGAQYDFFTRFIRLFFLPTFHPKIRSDLMKRVGEVMHLVSLHSEDDPTSEQCRSHLSSLLERSIPGALPSKDGSSRDPPDFLDAIAIVYSKGGSPRLTFGYVFLLGVLVHARHLAICLQTGSTGLEAARRRLHYVHPGFALTVVDATKHFLNSTDQSKTQLVRVSLDAVVAFLEGGPTESGKNDTSFDEAMDRLKLL